MKKVLAITVSALALGAAASSPAAAQLEVTVGGYTSFQAGVFDNDQSDSSDRDFQSEAQLNIAADGKADNGLEYGAKVTLDASTSDTANADETTVYLAGAWGRVELGDDDGASDLVVSAPTVGIGQINGSYDDFIPAGATANLLNNRGDHNFTAIDSDDSTKVTYYTPTFSGFQAGVSYAPEYQGFNLLGLTSLGGSSGENVALTENSTLASDIFEFGARYTGEFNGVGVVVGGNFVTADAIKDFAFDSDNNGSLDSTLSLEDVSAWTLGAKVSYNGFTVGGGYTDNGDSLQADGVGSDNVTSWNIGATYEQGPWGVGISYLDTDFDDNGVALTTAAGGTGGDYSVVALGGTYTVAPGLTTGLDVAFYDRDANGTANDDEGTVAVLDVTAAF